jgi:hypothetical protein
MPALNPKLFKLATAIKPIRQWVSIRRVACWWMTGQTDGTDVVLLYAGHEIHKNYLRDFFFQGECKEVYHGRTWCYRLPGMARRRKALLISEGAFDPMGSNQSAATSFFLPFWVGWQANLSTPLEKIVKANSSLQSDVRRIRKHTLTTKSLPAGADALDAFYNDMYLPYIQRQHQHKAALMTREEMQNSREACELLSVYKDTEPIGAMLIKHEVERPRLWSIGIVGGESEFLRAGAVGALYYYSVKYLQEQGAKSVHFGATRPFLQDGVLQYKRKWPIELAGYTSDGFQIQFMADTPALRNFLCDCPFLFQYSDGLRSALFMTADEARNLSTKKLRSIGKRYLLGGVKKLNLWIFDKDQMENELALPEDCSTLITVGGADTLLNP